MRETFGDVLKKSQLPSKEVSTLCEFTTPPCGFLRGSSGLSQNPVHHSAPFVWLSNWPLLSRPDARARWNCPSPSRCPAPAGSLTLRTLQPSINPSIKCLTSGDEVITSLIVLCLDPIWIRWWGHVIPHWHINTAAGTNGRNKTYCTLQLHDCVSMKCNTSQNQVYCDLNTEGCDSAVCAEICSTKKKQLHN